MDGRHFYIYVFIVFIYVELPFMIYVMRKKENDEKEVKEYHTSELSFKPRRKKERNTTDDAELKALEMLEKRESKSNLGD